MARYVVDVDLSASVRVAIEANSFEEAEDKINKMVWDEDEFIDTYRNDIYIWSPEVEQIIEEG